MKQKFMDIIIYPCVISILFRKSLLVQQAIFSINNGPFNYVPIFPQVAHYRYESGCANTCLSLKWEKVQISLGAHFVHGQLEKYHIGYNNLISQKSQGPDISIAFIRIYVYTGYDT